MAKRKPKINKPLHDWSRYRDKTIYGWKNLKTGTICQNVVKDSPAALYTDAGLTVDDPTLPHRGFQAVQINVNAAGILVEAGVPINTQGELFQ